MLNGVKSSYSMDNLSLNWKGFIKCIFFQAGRSFVMSEILQRGYANRNQFLSVAQLCFKDTIRKTFIDIKIKKGIKGYKEVLREGLVLKHFFHRLTCEFRF